MHCCTQTDFTRHRAIPPTIAITQLHRPVLYGKPCLNLCTAGLGLLALVTLIAAIAAWA